MELAVFAASLTVGALIAMVLGVVVWAVHGVKAGIATVAFVLLIALGLGVLAGAVGG